MSDIARRRVIASALFSLWLGVVLFAAWNHAVWRDEVRALSRALDGENVFAMLKALHGGEGHPALWYLLLRGAHTLVSSPRVLQAVALLVAAAAVLLLLRRSPFSWALIALLLAGNMFVFEYSVMARNYGISVLLLFLLAVFYKAHRDRGPLLGILLLLLANCNAHSLVLVGGFLLFWLVDIATGECADRSRALRTFLWNAAIALLGVAACIVTIFPSVNDSLTIGSPPGNVFTVLLKAVLLPAARFRAVMQVMPQPEFVSSSHAPSSLLSQFVLSLIMFGSTLGLIRRPGAFLAALATLAGLSLFFTFLYPGSYRHEALWLSFLICMYWITLVDADPPEPQVSVGWRALIRPASTVGWTIFLLLMAMQVPIGLQNVLSATGDYPPLSRTRDLADLIRSRPDLQDAIIVAEPDYLVESLPYYISNPTYLMREQRFGNVVVWTQKARLSLSLDDVLANARSLHAASNKPVVILLAHAVDPFLPKQIIHEAYAWEFVTTPEQRRTFLASTQLIENFSPALMDETFDMYLLK
jgi:hypothetical protein